MSAMRPLLSDILDPAVLAAEILDQKITRRTHPTLPLSIYTYGRSCQYENYWTPVTTACRGLVVDDSTGRIAAFCLPKFFNHGQHGKGYDYAPPLPEDESFEVYDKVDGSLGIVFHYDGAWRLASKGSFISEQAEWGQRYIDKADMSALDPSVTYIAEILYPENRIVVNYGDRKDLVLLAAFEADGTELPLADAAKAWEGIGSVVRTFDGRDSIAVMVRMGEENAHLDGSEATGTDAEGWVVRFAGGVRTKIKISEYVRLHRTLTGVGARDVWRAFGVQLHPDATVKQITQAIGVPAAEVEEMRAAEVGPLSPLLDNVPDEFDAWVRGVCAELSAQSDALIGQIEVAFAALSELVGDRGAFARAIQAYDPVVRAGLFLKLDGRPLGLHVWRTLRPEASGPFRDDDEG
jgi:RNA ligase